jgi:DNA-binding Lrp family transcriptional regulator
VGLSQSPCLVRTKRLQETGVIRGYGANIALEKLGNCVSIFSEVTIGSHRPADFRKFEEAVDRHHEIVEWFNVSGGYDYLLKIVAPNVGHFQELMERLLQEDMGIEKFTSRIVLRQSSGRRTYPLHLIAGQILRT